MKKQSAELRENTRAARVGRARAQDGWTPVRDGDAYCSPRCGAGAPLCTVQRYEHAVDVSNAVAKDLGTGWHGRVWENLGWHASVISPCRRIKISLPTRPTDTWYTAFLGPVEKYDHCSGKWAESGRTAREAIENVLNAAKHDLGIIEESIVGLSVPPKPLRRKALR